MENYPKFSRWLEAKAPLREVLDQTGRGSSEDADAQLLRDFEAMIKRDGGISQAVKNVYKHQMEANPEMVPHLNAIVKKYQKAAAPAATAPGEEAAPDPSTMSTGKRGKLNTEVRKAVNDWIDTKVLLPANDKATPEQIVQSKPFKAMIAPLPQRDRDTVTQEAIRSIAEKRKAKFTTDNHAAADAAFAKKAAAAQPTSGPTATPPAAAPAATPATGGGFGSWLKKKFGGS